MKPRAAAFLLVGALACGHVAVSADEPAAGAVDLRQAAREQAQREAAARIDAAPARGLLYRIERDGRSGHLFGSIHVGHPRFYPLDRSTTESMRASGEFWFEVDPRRMEEVGSAFSRDRTRASNARLSPATLGRLAAARRALGLPAQAPGRLDALGEALRLSYDYAGTLGLDSNAAPERYVLGFARSAGAPVQALESPDEHVAVLTGLADEGEALLEDTIEGATSGRVPREVAAQIEAWEAANEAALARLQRAALDPTRSPAVARIHERLLCDRNRRWLAPLVDAIDRGRRPFATVGVFHVVGRCNLADLLRERGFEVVRVARAAPRPP